MTARLILPRGLPGCGKTTLVRAWVAKCPTRRARLSRDDFRDMIYGPGWYQRPAEEVEHAEDGITVALHAAARALLNDGWDVAIDATNLDPDHLTEAILQWHTVEIWDMTDVPESVCIANDRNRIGTGGHLGHEVISGMWWTYLREKPYPLPLPDSVTRKNLTITAPHRP